MPLTVIVGGQYGSEGKGKVAHWFAREGRASVAVRTGGPNAGHTVIDEAQHSLVLRQLPTAAILPDITCVLGAGSYIEPDRLLKEISRTGLDDSRLLIDPNATVISEEDKATESDGKLRASIGSTQSGTGAAVVRRIERCNATLLAKNDVRLARYVRPVSEFLRSQLSGGKRIVLEGTQGFGLSLLHSPHYPFVTSRDTTAAAFVSEAGLSPLDVDQVVLVLRAYPIRVAGNSGLLEKETEWVRITEESGSPIPIMEYTSVTHCIRRVARFEPAIVRAAIRVNSPTQIVVNHVDYVDYQARVANSLTPKTVRFIDTLETEIERSIDYLGLGPDSLIKRKIAFSKIRSA
ncbi:MAG TPA: adenylosuccinate synthetase [Pyrinomonadaceae bacterium]|nr:adenylosuccinate synthetase [Pyrinomonadaceae bacterium]